MAQLKILPPAAKFLKKLKDKRLKALYQEAIDRILEDHTVGEAKTGDLAGVFGYDIYYNKTNYELAYTVEYVEDKVIVVILAGTRENFSSSCRTGETASSCWQTAENGAWSDRNEKSTSMCKRLGRLRPGRPKKSDAEKRSATANSAIPSRSCAGQVIQTRRDSTWQNPI